MEYLPVRSQYHREKERGGGNRENGEERGEGDRATERQSEGGGRETGIRERRSKVSAKGGGSDREKEQRGRDKG